MIQNETHLLHEQPQRQWHWSTQWNKGASSLHSVSLSNRITSLLLLYPSRLWRRTRRLARQLCMMRTRTVDNYTSGWLISYLLLMFFSVPSDCFFDYKTVPESMDVEFRRWKWVHFDVFWYSHSWSSTWLFSTGWRELLIRSRLTKLLMSMTMTDENSIFTHRFRTLFLTYVSKEGRNHWNELVKVSLVEKRRNRSN